MCTHQFTHGRDRYTVYGVFDGHGVSADANVSEAHIASHIAASRLPIEFEHLVRATVPPANNGAGHAAYTAAVRRALREAYWKVEATMEQHPQRAVLCRQGTTAVLLAIVNDRLLVVSNAGDSRAVSVRHGGGVVCRSLTVDHKPYTVLGTTTNEPRRIKQLGWSVSLRQRDRGRVRYERMRRIFPNAVETDDYRIVSPHTGMPAVNLSRGLADLVSDREQRPTARDQYAVTPEPYLATVLLTPRHRYIVLGTDGLFDALSNDNVARIAEQYVSSEIRHVYPNDVYCTALRHKTLQRIGNGVCRALAHEARKLGSSDDISVILVPVHVPS